MTIRTAVLHTAEEYLTRDPEQVAALLGKPVDVVDCAMRALKRDGRLRGSVRKPERKRNPYLYGKGELHPNAILTEHDVRLVMQLKGELPGAEVARKMGCEKTTIYNIWHGRRWRHVTVMTG